MWPYGVCLIFCNLMDLFCFICISGFPVAAQPPMRQPMPIQPPIQPPQHQPPPPQPISTGPPQPHLEQAILPRRPGTGKEGRPITLRANHFRIAMPLEDIHHYDVSIMPDKCPRRVNREVIETLVKHSTPKIFTNQLPVFDGRKNLYSREQLPIGKERVRWHQHINLQI